MCREQEGKKNPETFSFSSHGSPAGFYSGIQALLADVLSGRAGIFLFVQYPRQPPNCPFRRDSHSSDKVFAIYAPQEGWHPIPMTSWWQLPASLSLPTSGSGTQPEPSLLSPPQDLLCHLSLPVPVVGTEEEDTPQTPGPSLLRLAGRLPLELSNLCSSCRGRRHSGVTFSLLGSAL